MDGETVAFATSFPTVEEGTNYCTSNWCTTETSSIFTYAEGEDHGTFDLCDAVYVGPVLPDAIPAAITEVHPIHTLISASIDPLCDPVDTFTTEKVVIASVFGGEISRKYPRVPWCTAVAGRDMFARTRLVFCACTTKSTIFESTPQRSWRCFRVRSYSRGLGSFRTSRHRP